MKVISEYPIYVNNKMVSGLNESMENEGQGFNASSCFDNSSNSETKKFQNWYNENMWDRQGFVKLIVDGIYGAKTQAAYKKAGGSYEYYLIQEAKKSPTQTAGKGTTTSPVTPSADKPFSMEPEVATKADIERMADIEKADKKEKMNIKLKRGLIIGSIALTALIIIGILRKHSK